MTQRPIGCIQQKRKAQDGLHNSICTHLSLEVRNAELYDYRCPNADWDKRGHMETYDDIWGHMTIYA